ncbi:MAG: hypothetical protein NUV75_06270 [Gallionella sp.]|nr:hypothetical protein [Gallionella sp.]
MPKPHTQRDYFAELYAAAIFGDAGWSVYFPKRDVGFDFVISKEVDGQVLLRPVQVKGLYPTEKKGDKPSYGYQGELSAVHPQMVLVLTFFAATERGVAPERVAYMPYDQLKKPSRGGYRCVPAVFKSGHAVPRREFNCFFGEQGLKAIESSKWGEGG